MTAERLNEILTKHKLFLNRERGGSRANLSEAHLRRADLRWANLSDADLSRANLSRANLSDADLSGDNLRWANLSEADLSGANLSDADLSRANLSRANLSRANLRWANLSDADLSGADLSGADLSGANLRWANLSDADLSRANLSGANLSGANLSGANLSGAEGLLSTADYLEWHFERTENGYIAYKTFNSSYSAPENWNLAPGSIIEENVNSDRCTECGCGINVAPLDWVKAHHKGVIWKVLIRWEWLCGVCIPYMTDGKIRCERVELLEVVESI